MQLVGDWNGAPEVPLSSLRGHIQTILEKFNVIMTLGGGGGGGGMGSKTMTLIRSALFRIS